MTLRTAGIALLAVCILFMIGASVAAYFRRFPIPTDPLEQLTLIANDRAGWTAQAGIFPVCFLAFVIIFGWMATRQGWLSGRQPTYQTMCAASRLKSTTVTNLVTFGVRSQVIIARIAA